MLMDKLPIGEIIVRLHNQGRSYDEIAQTLGISKSTVAYHCSDTYKKKVKKRMHDRRSYMNRLIQEKKHYHPCADCGQKYPYWVMQFDHLGDKAFTISDCKKHHVSKERLLEEMEKCDIVCANCHAERTHKRSLGLEI